MNTLAYNFLLSLFCPYSSASFIWESSHDSVTFGQNTSILHILWCIWKHGEQQMHGRQFQLNRIEPQIFTPADYCDECVGSRVVHGLGWIGSNKMDPWTTLVGSSVCLSVSISREPHKLYQISTDVTRGCGSVFRWQRSNHVSNTSGTWATSSLSTICQTKATQVEVKIKVR